MSQPKPTYEELEQRCYKAEAMLEAIRSGQTDTIIGEQGVLALRLAEAEEALRLNRERLSLALEAAQAGVWEWNLKTNQDTWSEELWSVYGLEPHSSQPSYEAWLQVIHPADRAETAQAMQTAAANGTEMNAEWRVLDRDGTERWLMSRGRPVRDAAGEIGCYIGIALDITERKQAEIALRESEARYRLLAENIADVIWVLNTKSMYFTYVSPSIERLRGYSVAEVMVQPLAQLVTSDSLALINAELPDRLQAFLAGDPAAVTQMHEVEQPRKDGSTVWTEIVTTFLQNEAGEIEVLGVSRDISARKQAERASRLKDDLLRLTGEMAHVGGWEFDADTLQGTWTDEVARIHNLDPGQATNVELGISFYLPESRQKIEHAIKEALELARPYDLELELVSATGQHKWVRTMGLPISEGSRVVKVRGIFQDITERRQTEAALRESEERYRKLLELAPIGITVHCEGKIVSGANFFCSCPFETLITLINR